MLPKLRLRFAPESQLYVYADGAGRETLLDASAIYSSIADATHEVCNLGGNIMTWRTVVDILGDFGDCIDADIDARVWHKVIEAAAVKYVGGKSARIKPGTW